MVVSAAAAMQSPAAAVVYNERNGKNETPEAQAMAGGWSRDGAVQDQIDASVEDAVRLARSRMQDGRGLAECEDCGEPIPEARRRAMPNARRCVACQEAADRDASPGGGGFNRRGSKDSQLR